MTKSDWIPTNFMGIYNNNHSDDCKLNWLEGTEGPPLLSTRWLNPTGEREKRLSIWRKWGITFALLHICTVMPVVLYEWVRRRNLTIVLIWSVCEGFFCNSWSYSLFIGQIFYASYFHVVCPDQRSVSLWRLCRMPSSDLLYYVSKVTQKYISIALCAN